MVHGQHGISGACMHGLAPATHVCMLAWDRPNLLSVCHVDQSYSIAILPPEIQFSSRQIPVCGRFSEQQRTIVHSSTHL